MSLGPPYAPFLPARIRERLDVVETSPGVFCWLWTGPLTAGGYARVWSRGRDQAGHRVAYAAARGPIPPGRVLDHECHDPASCPGGDSCPHRRCLNPWHVTATTQAHNASRDRAAHRFRYRGAVCRNGRHDVTAPGALYTYPDGRTECLACKRAARARASA